MALKNPRGKPKRH